jgi:hypothetical protein
MGFERQDEGSVLAARNEDCEDHQVGVREQPALGLFSGCPRGAGDGAEVFAARQVAQVLAADSGQAGDFFFGEDFLTRLDGDHYLYLPSRRLRSRSGFVKTASCCKERKYRARTLPFRHSAF